MLLRDGVNTRPGRRSNHVWHIDTMRVAILDDYQSVALQMANWSEVAARAEITVFTDHVSGQDAVIERLAPFDVVCVMRERTPLPRAVIERLPRLKMIASTGPFNAAIDVAAAKERGIYVSTTGGYVESTVELTWALILAAARGVVDECQSVRAGGWQTSVGRQLGGTVLGVLGLGRIGTRVARVGAAFGMEIIAWSTNLTPEAAERSGATYVAREELFSRADVLTIHLVLSDRSRGLVGAAELALMKPTALLVNTSRGPIVDEMALIDALRSHRLGGAGLDVFDTEPLPTGHPLRSLDSVVSTPHIGYVADRVYRTFYGEASAKIAAWLGQASGG
jgi:phosphoglycerate dehydrogenase-like enzyme